MKEQNERERTFFSETRSLIKSAFSFSWAMSMFGIRQMNELMRSGAASAGKSFDKVSSAAAQNISQSPLNNSPSNGKTPQAKKFPDPAINYGEPQTRRKVDAGRLNTSVFVALGESLAAGAGNFAVYSEVQQTSFPAQMARQMQTKFVQPLIEPPGLGNFAGFAEQPVVLPNLTQTTVLEHLPPVAAHNLSVPCFRLKDALELRPCEPLIHRRNAKQTAANVVLGLRAISRGEKEMPTQLDAALAQKPTFAMVELGYYEALESAVGADPQLLPEIEDFHFDLARLHANLQETGADILILTIPDPFDTAHFTDLSTAAKTLKVEPSVLLHFYNFNELDLITLKGLNEIGFQIFGRSFDSLPEGSTIDRETASEISHRIGDLNEEINALASESQTMVFDLHKLFREIKRQGFTVGTKKLNAEYLGGFYSLNGYYPGATGQALIASEILLFLNRQCGANFPPVDIFSVSQTDPVYAYKQAEGPVWSLRDLQQPRPQDAGEPPKPKHDIPGKNAGKIRTNGNSSAHILELPPNLEQTLPLDKKRSYFGDGIGAVDCSDARGIQWGSNGNYLFGGLAMVDSHLSGHLHIRFSPPENDLTTFTVSFPNGLAGDDSVLTTPVYFKMAFQQARVDAVPGTVSSGVLNLRTGEVSDFKLYAQYSSSALFALVSTNPTFPRQPLMFPGQYGSADVRFEQRADGLLDFTFYGSTFVPLGGAIEWTLNFMSRSGNFATIPARGTAMHPHLSLSTKATAEAPQICPDVDFDTVNEYTLMTHNSSFGDQFTLEIPQLGGYGKGRSHILGRALIQFGSRTGNTVPIAVSLLRLGGIMDELADSPIVDVFPGKLTAGAQGFDEVLRFPQRNYSLDDLAILSDPFDLSVGAIDLETGEFVNDLLHRGFINQDLIFALLRVEPRTPKDSFYFRGPARIEKGDCRQNIFRFQGIVRVPYPAGFNFPQPNLTTAFIAGPNSSLDPFLWIQAIQNGQSETAQKEGRGDRVTGSVGEIFSYKYRISNDPADKDSFFEYENHTQKGSFKMHSLAWVDFCNSRGCAANNKNYDTVSFTCFGVWTKDGVRSIQQASVQISTSKDAPYVGIQINNGAISNVNTKPENEETAIP